jgi:hypothetical protein
MVMVRCDRETFLNTFENMECKSESEVDGIGASAPNAICCRTRTDYYPVDYELDYSDPMHIESRVASKIEERHKERRKFYYFVNVSD